MAGGFASSKLISPDAQLEVAEVIVCRELVARFAEDLDGQTSDALGEVRAAVLNLRHIAKFVAAETALCSADEPTCSGKGAARESLAAGATSGDDGALAAQRHGIAMGQLECPWAHVCSASKRGAEVPIEALSRASSSSRCWCLSGTLHFAPELVASEALASNLQRVAESDVLSLLRAGEAGASADETSIGGGGGGREARPSEVERAAEGEALLSRVAEVEAGDGGPSTGADRLEAAGLRHGRVLLHNGSEAALAEGAGSSVGRHLVSGCCLVGRVADKLSLARKAVVLA